ncbi:hypothetical protein [uncultured Tateyamaria sp.]|nr:hypothetical protein [uncultured Tateyamaria sp.]
MTLTYLLKPLGPKGMISRALKSDLAGETRGLMAVRNEMAQYIAGDIFEENEERLLVTETGDARFVVTLPEIPMVITYSGRCEVIE